MKIWVVIPAYNESQHLSSFIRALKDKGLSVLVVDDGSVDQTYPVAKKDADVVLKNPKNYGKGVSLRKALEYLLENKFFDYLITMDGDRQHSPLDLDKFISRAQSGAFFLIGNRMENPAGMPRLRLFTNLFMSWLVSKIVKQKIPDSQCGFRMLKREVAERLAIRTKKFEIESEMLIKVSRLGYRIESVPIKSIYNKGQASKIRPFSDALRFMAFILRLKK